MKLEFLDDISGGGKFKGVVSDQLIRLYAFDNLEAAKFKQEIQQTIIEKREPLDLSKVEFIEMINCSLIMRLANSDIGITSANKSTFVCDLTTDAYETMLKLIEPFCFEESGSYQWLYDPINTPIDFLFSPGGTW